MEYINHTGNVYYSNTLWIVFFIVSRWAIHKQSIAEVIMSNKKFWNYNRRDFAFNIIELIYVMKLDWRFSEYTALIASVKVSKQTNNKTIKQK